MLIIYSLLFLFFSFLFSYFLISLVLFSLFILSWSVSLISLLSLGDEKYLFYIYGNIINNLANQNNYFNYVILKLF